MKKCRLGTMSLFAKLYGLRGHLLKERVEEALEFVGLQDRAKEKPSTFSGDEKTEYCMLDHTPSEADHYG